MRAAFHDTASGNHYVDPASTCGTPPNTAGDLYNAGTGHDTARGSGFLIFGALATLAFRSGRDRTIAGISDSVYDYGYCGDLRRFIVPRSRRVPQRRSPETDGRHPAGMFSFV